MKTFIIGYSDRGALSAAQIVCDLESPAGEQAEVMDRASRLHAFPKGILRLEQYAIDEPIETAIFISDETAAACQDRDAERRKQEKIAQQKRAEQQKAEANLITANKAFTLAAQNRNAAIAAVAAQKNVLANQPGDEKALKEIAKLQPIADRAIAEFKVILELRDIIKNPKSTPEDFAAAVKLISDPAKALDLKNKSLADAKAANDAAAKAIADKAAADKGAADAAAGNPA
jgi:hypothetical protein